MKLVKISGPESVIDGLEGVVDVEVVRNTAELLDSGDLRVAAYITDSAVGGIESAGATIEVVIDTPDLDQLFAGLQTRIDDQDPVA